MSKPASKMRLEEIEPCPGSGQRWLKLRQRTLWVCSHCNAGPATLQVPDPQLPGENMPTVPDHPNMVIWSGRVDVTQWRITRATMRDYPEETP